MSSSPLHVLAFPFEDVVATSAQELVSRLVDFPAGTPEPVLADARLEFARSLSRELQLRYLSEDATDAGAALVSAAAGRSATVAELDELALLGGSTGWAGEWEWPTPLVIVGPALDGGNIVAIDPSSDESLLHSLDAAGVVRYFRA